MGGTGDPKPVVTETDPPKTTTSTTVVPTDGPAAKPTTTTETVASTTSTTVTAPVVTAGQPAITNGEDKRDRDVLYGDANESGDVNISDAVLIMQSLSNPSKYKLTGQGKVNADCSGVGDGVTNKDALAIQKYMLKIIKALPESN